MKCFFVIQHIKGTQPGFWMYDKLKEHGFNVIARYAFKSGEVEKSWLRMLRSMYNVLYVFIFAQEKDLIFYYDNMAFASRLAFLYWLFGSKCCVYCGNMMGFEHVNSLKKWVIQKSFNNLYVATNSPEMRQRQIEQLGVPEDHICVIPDCVDLYAKDFEHKYSSIVKEGDYIFMGGNTRRDYGLLVSIAHDHPEYRFVVIANNTYKQHFTHKPKNIELYYNVSGDFFYEKLAQCKLVFIPLTSDLQGGQIVLFGAALLRKPIITTNSCAISSYFTTENSFLIGVGDKLAAENAIKYLYNATAMDIEKLTESAYNSVKRYDAEHTYNRIFDLLIKNKE